ncbi:putative meiotically up-regulated gene 14 protein [[Candida] railenensis]|uniref:Meiotically up-regulated gene 14 protein n=1 Tax=[Candida] railenensis TaxID=45579 RepID=A0A9P0QL22_9ASCO|nr:putative meiotically up-regulated gene 14 protein [[Candida] railenensis]
MTPAAHTSSNSTSKNYQTGKEGSHNLAKGLEHPDKIPVFTDLYEKREWMKQHMAGAFRVFGRKGYTEGSAGHISIKDPVQQGTFWINPLNKHFSLINASDLVHIDMECNVLPTGAQVAVNAAGFSIHAAIHKARPDIVAACHTHSIYGKAYSTFGRELEMINQDVCMLYKRHVVFTNFGGIALDSQEGEEIAEALGENGVAAILQNHGLLTVGSTVDEAAYLFTLMENSCRAQLLCDAAAASGIKKNIIPDDVAQYTLHMTGDMETLYAEFQPDLNYEVAMTKGEFLK